MEMRDAREAGGETRATRARLGRRILLSLVLVMVSVALLEVVLIAIRQVPVLSLSAPVGRLARELYFLDRSMIQHEPFAAIYDPYLGYTLRPGVFHFSNTEFDTTYRVNRLGVRDDDASLVAPKVVVVGDSFAMGWGVEQDETFASLLEFETGWKVLNTGISSYGTVRELRMLERVDLSAAEWLVIQFCANDYVENRRFVDEGPDLRPIERDQYLQSVENHVAEQQYWFGRYAWTLMRNRAGTATGEDGPAPMDPEDPATRRRQIDQFLAVLQDSPVDLSSLHIVVFELNGDNQFGHWFAETLRRTLDDRVELPAHLRSMVVLDIAADLTSADFYRLDDHIRPSGHRIVAERLLEVIVERGASP